jgi:hypothetical protein
MDALYIDGLSHALGRGVPRRELLAALGGLSTSILGRRVITCSVIKTRVRISYEMCVVCGVAHPATDRRKFVAFCRKRRISSEPRELLLVVPLLLHSWRTIRGGTVALCEP